MTPKLKDEVRKLILAELKRLLEEFKHVRSLRLSESDDATRKDYLSKRVELARGKLDDLKRIQKRDKEVRDRRRQIAQDNAERN